jgi:hypothetical protein
MNQVTADDKRIEDRVLHEVHQCIAPACESRANAAFIAAEMGVFGGRQFNEGDFIDLCWPHAKDVYRAQDVTDRAQLAEWLRADVG